MRVLLTFSPRADARWHYELGIGEHGLAEMRTDHAIRLVHILTHTASQQVAPERITPAG